MDAPDAPPGAAPADAAGAADAAPAENQAGHAAAVAAAANAAAANAAGMFPVPPLNFHVHVPPPPGMHNANAQQRGRRNETANEYCALFVALIGEGKDPQVFLLSLLLACARPVHMEGSAFAFAQLSHPAGRHEYY